MLRMIFITIALMTTACSDAASNCTKEDTLKLIGAGFTKAEISDMCGQAGKRASTDTKSSAVEGKLVDWNGAPVADVKITAAQQQPIKGYEQFETVTQSDGTFRIEGLYPSSHYVLKPWSKKWRSEIAAQVGSAPQGETAVLPSAMVISEAFAKSGGSLVTDLATGATRFSVSGDGVISDSQTGLEWLVGPDQDTDYNSAERWIASIGDVAGGNWRMPTRGELKSLYQKGVGKHNRDPAFKSSDSWVWAEPYDSSAWYFYFNNGSEGRHSRNDPYGFRVLGVRSRSQLKTSKKSQPSSSQATDVSKDKNRFSKDKTTGVIIDSKTGLDWMVGPDKDTDYKKAEQWIASISDAAGGNWRMPTRNNLKSLYQKGVGERNMDPAFKTTGWFVWAEPYDSSSAWYFYFYYGNESRNNRDNSDGARVFGVRSRPR